MRKKKDKSEKKGRRDLSECQSERTFAPVVANKGVLRWWSMLRKACLPIHVARGFELSTSIFSSSSWTANEITSLGRSQRWINLNDHIKITFNKEEQRERKMR